MSWTNQDIKVFMHGTSNVYWKKSLEQAPNPTTFEKNPQKKNTLIHYA